MQPDKLIHNNAYTYLDDDGQPRQALYDRTVILPNHRCGYRFRVEDYYTRSGKAVNLTEDEVKTRIFRASNVPQ